MFGKCQYCSTGEKRKGGVTQGGMHLIDCAQMQIIDMTLKMFHLSDRWDAVS